MPMIIAPLYTASGGMVVAPLVRAGTFALDSVPQQILRGTAFSVIVSGSAVTPTPANVTATYAALRVYRVECVSAAV
jgi:hypothetical protein